MDINEYKKYLNKDVAGVMLTSPNTLGLFNPQIKIYAIWRTALMRWCIMMEPTLMRYWENCVGDVGFDIVHLNLHKTFATRTAAADRAQDLWE